MARVLFRGSPPDVRWHTGAITSQLIKARLTGPVGIAAFRSASSLHERGLRKLSAQCASADGLVVVSLLKVILNYRVVGRSYRTRFSRLDDDQDDVRRKLDVEDGPGRLGVIRELRRMVEPIHSSGRRSRAFLIRFWQAVTKANNKKTVIRVSKTDNTLIVSPAIDVCATYAPSTSRPSVCDHRQRHENAVKPSSLAKKTDHASNC